MSLEEEARRALEDDRRRADEQQAEATSRLAAEAAAEARMRDRALELIALMQREQVSPIPLHYDGLNELGWILARPEEVTWAAAASKAREPGYPGTLVDIDGIARLYCVPGLLNSKGFIAFGYRCPPLTTPPAPVIDEALLLSTAKRVLSGEFVQQDGLTEFADRARLDPSLWDVQRRYRQEHERRIAHSAAS